MAVQISGGYRLPHWLLAVYALLFMVLGWSGASIWAGYHPPPVCAVLPSLPLLAAPSPPAAVTQRPADVCQDNVLPPLRYSAHVYAEEPSQRSVTLNGQQYREEESLPCGAVVAQIQQDVTLLELHGRVVVLDALEDWPGGAPDEGDDDREGQP